MTWIYLKDVPGYLRGSALCESFVESDEEIEIPEQYLKSDPSAESTKEFIHLMNTIRFWGVRRLPVGICRYLIDDVSYDAEEMHSIITIFHQHTEYLSLLVELRSEPADDRFKHALSHSSCDVDLLQYLWDSKCILPDDANCAAVKTGKILFLEWVHERTRSVQQSVGLLPVIAATEGHLPMLKYLHEHDFSWGVWVCAAAAEGGHLDCLTYAHENGCGWDSQTLINAAINGHLDCLTYAYEHGCTDWTSEQKGTTAQIAANGHLDCLQFAHEHGCSWSIHTVNRAFRYKQWDCMYYAKRNGAFAGDVTHSVLCIVGFVAHAIAAINYNFGLVDWLLALILHVYRLFYHIAMIYELPFLYAVGVQWIASAITLTCLYYVAQN